VWLYLHSHINTQKNRYWLANNLRVLHRVLLHDIKVGVWCAVSTIKIIRLITFSNTVNSRRYTGQILTPLFENLGDERNKHRSFLQDSALCNIFRDQIISHPLLTACPSNLTCDYYLWLSLKVLIKQTTDMGWPKRT